MSEADFYRSRDTRLGVGLVLFVLVTAATAWFVSRPRDTGPILYVEYGQVYGLTRGDPVTLNGLRVGDVEAIETEFLDRGAVRFRVTLRLSDDLRAEGGDSLLLPLGTRARIVPAVLPFLGGTEIRLVPDFEGSSRLADADQVPGTTDTALLDQISGRADQLIASVETVTTQLTALVDSIQTTRSEAERTLRMVRSEVPTLTARLDERLSSIDALLASADAEIRGTGPVVRELIDSLTVLTSDAGALIESVDRTVNTRVPDVDLILSRLDSAAFIVNHLTQRLSERPLRVLWGVDVPDTIPVRPSVRSMTGDSAGGGTAAAGRGPGGG